MPVITPNTADMEDLTPTEPGTYPAKIVSCEATKSKAGNAMIVPKIEVSAKDEKGKPVTKTRLAYLVTEGKGTSGFDALLRACHMDEIADRYRNGERVPFDTDSLIGQEILVVMDQEMYDDDMRDRLKNFLKK